MMRRTPLLFSLLLGLPSCGTVSAVGTAKTRDSNLTVVLDATQISHEDSPTDGVDLQFRRPILSDEALVVPVESRSTCPRATLKEVTYGASRDHTYRRLEQISPLSGPANAWLGTGIDLAAGAAVLGGVWLNGRRDPRMTPARYTTQRNVVLGLTGGVLAVDLAAIGYASSRKEQDKMRTIPERVACADWRPDTFQNHRATLSINGAPIQGPQVTEPHSAVELTAQLLGSSWLLMGLQPTVPKDMAFQVEVAGGDTRYAPPFLIDLAPEGAWPPPPPAEVSKSFPLDSAKVQPYIGPWVCTALDDPELMKLTINLPAGELSNWVETLRPHCDEKAEALRGGLCERAGNTVAEWGELKGGLFADGRFVFQSFAPHFRHCDINEGLTKVLAAGLTDSIQQLSAVTECKPDGKEVSYSSVRRRWRGIEKDRSEFDTMLPDEWVHQENQRIKAALALSLSNRLKSETCGTRDNWKTVSKDALDLASVHASPAIVKKVKANTRVVADRQIRSALKDESVYTASGIIDTFESHYGAAWARTQRSRVAAVQRKIDAREAREAREAERAAARRRSSRSRSSGSSTGRRGNECVAAFYRCAASFSDANCYVIADVIENCMQQNGQSMSYCPEVEHLTIRCEG